MKKLMDSNVTTEQILKFQESWYKANGVVIPTSEILNAPMLNGSSNSEERYVLTIQGKYSIKYIVFISDGEKFSDIQVDTLSEIFDC